MDLNDIKRAIQRNDGRRLRLLLSPHKNILRDKNFADRFFWAIFRLVLPKESSKAIPLMRILLDVGADLNVKDDKGRTPLFTVAALGRSMKLMEFLLENGADPFAVNALGKTPLMAVCYRFDLDAIDVLLSYVDKARRRAYINATDMKGSNAFLYALASGKIQSQKVRRLLRLMANPFERDPTTDPTIPRMLFSPPGDGDPDGLPLPSVNGTFCRLDSTGQDSTALDTTCDDTSTKMLQLGGHGTFVLNGFFWRRTEIATEIPFNVGSFANSMMQQHTDEFKILGNNSTRCVNDQTAMYVGMECVHVRNQGATLQASSMMLGMCSQSNMLDNNGQTILHTSSRESWQRLECEATSTPFRYGADPTIRNDPGNLARPTTAGIRNTIDSSSISSLVRQMESIGFQETE